MKGHIMKIGLLAVVLVLCAGAQTQVDAPTQIKNLPYLDARSYNFKPIKPGGTLNSGGATVTMSPFPQGLAAGYTLYVSGGSGTAEACSITGVSNPTISLNCANTHSSTYQITSATNGIQEAVQVLKTAGIGGTVKLPVGVLSQCGTVTVDTDGIVISGAGSIGTGPKQTGGNGVSGTQIKPCFANQVLFNVPNGYGFGGAGTTGSTVAKLSMNNIGFTNNALAGVTAIKLLRDAGGIYTNLNFAGTTSSFYGIYCDRCWGTQVENITSSGTEGSFFGSSVDNALEPTSWAYATVTILNWTHDGAGAGIPAMVFQRCVSCRLAHSNFVDESLTVTGTAVQVLNDSQGCAIDDITAEGYLAGISVLSNTVSASTVAPGWTTISNYQYDCAGGANCLGSTPVGLTLGAGSFETGVLNPTFTAVTTTGVALSASGVVSGHNVFRVVGGVFDFTQPLAQIALVGPLTGAQITGNTFITFSPSGSIFMSGSGSVSNAIISNNLINGTSTAPIVVIGPTVANSYIANNLCPSDAFGLCTGGLAPAFQRDSLPVTFATVPTCASITEGARATINNSNTNTWGATIAGGGANIVQAYCNGTNWTVSGK